MSRLTRDGTAKPVSQKFSGANGDNEIFPCSADHEQDWQPYAVDLYSAISDDHTCIHIYCSVYPQLQPVIGAPWGCCGPASGIYFPVCYGSVGVQLTRLRALCQGTLTSENVLEKSERSCLASYLYNAAILASFFLFACVKRCFRLSLSNRNKKHERSPAKNTPRGQQTSNCVYCSLKTDALSAYQHVQCIFCAVPSSLRSFCLPAFKEKGE